MKHLCFAISLLALLSLGRASLAEDAAAPSLTFERDIRPILKANCLDCHGMEKGRQAKLDLRLRRLMLAGGESGPALTPGDPQTSLIYKRIVAHEMPPGEKKLSDEEIAKIGNWISSGGLTLRDEPPGIENDLITPEERVHWAYQGLAAVQIPDYPSEDRVRTPIDGLLLKSMKPRGLAFAPDADRLTLLKRAYLDLIGLPPRADEIAEFMGDKSSDAYERMIERLLASPRYGERWARHWLDVAGYAESEGYTDADLNRPHIFRYRDWVIRALNADKPIDQFIIEQLAGDELVQGRYCDLPPEQLDKVIATGFLRTAPDGTSSGPPDMDLAKNAVVAETIKIVSSAYLGLTFGCAQCHDHRYDPIPQVDYYRLRAVFEPAFDWKNWRTPDARTVSLYTDAQREAVAAINSQVAAVQGERSSKAKEYIASALEKELEKHPSELRDPLRAAFNAPTDQRTPEQTKLLDEHPSVKISEGVLYQYNQQAADELKKFDGQMRDLLSKKPIENLVACVAEPPESLPKTTVFYRGDHRQPLEEVLPGPPRILAPPGQTVTIPPDDPTVPTSGRRLAFARWLVSDAQPLTRRVLVNRVWLHHFGKGLVGTPGDFGILGDQPSHPELLDFLAAELSRSGWSLKHLHRLIMTSTVYRQSSVTSPELRKLDPENLLYARMPIRRLDAETIRDRMLSATGLLNGAMFGPSVPILDDGVGIPTVGDVAGDPITPASSPPLGKPEYRRSIYLQVRRTKPLPGLTVFDAPVMATNCERRVPSTVATQALYLMNNEFVLDQSAWLAARIRREAGEDPARQIRRAYELAYCRGPSDEELLAATSWLTRHQESARQMVAAGTAIDPGFQPMIDFCQALLSSNEFLYFD